jgi:hypothetical protein
VAPRSSHCVRAACGWAHSSAAPQQERMALRFQTGGPRVQGRAPCWHAPGLRSRRALRVTAAVLPSSWPRGSSGLARAAAVQAPAEVQAAPAPLTTAPVAPPATLLTKLVKAHAAGLVALCVLKDGSSKCVAPLHPHPAEILACIARPAPHSLRPALIRRRQACCEFRPGQEPADHAAHAGAVTALQNHSSGCLSNQRAMGRPAGRLA